MFFRNLASISVSWPAVVLLFFSCVPPVPLAAHSRKINESACGGTRSDEAADTEVTLFPLRRQIRICIDHGRRRPATPSCLYATYFEATDRPVRDDAAIAPPATKVRASSQENRVTINLTPSCGVESAFMFRRVHSCCGLVVLMAVVLGGVSERVTTMRQGP